MKRIVIINDDPAMEIAGDAFRYRGQEVQRISSPTDALSRIEEIASADLVILDMIMSWPGGELRHALSGDQAAGMQVFCALRARAKQLPIITYSATQDGSIIGALRVDPASVIGVR